MCARAPKHDLLSVGVCVCARSYVCPSRPIVQSVRVRAFVCVSVNGLLVVRVSVSVRAFVCVSVNGLLSVRVLVSVRAFLGVSVNVLLAVRVSVSVRAFLGVPVHGPIHSPAPFPLLSGGITSGRRQDGL